MKQLSLIVFAVAALGLLAGCSDPDPTTSGTGEVRLLLTDAPIDLSAVSAVNVTFTHFTLWPADESAEAGIVMGMSGGDTINLLDYQDGSVVLVASAEVPSGDYRRIRLEISSAELLRDDDGDPMTPDVAEPIVVPSGKVDVPVTFSLEAGDSMEVTLDFDAERSVQVNATAGNPEYVLRPVIVPVGVRSR